MESLIVGVDVSKESFSAAGLDGKGTRLPLQAGRFVW